MKKYIAGIVLVMVSVAAMAVPAHPRTKTVRQSDGTTLTLRLVGDEHGHYYVDTQSGRKMKQVANGQYAEVTATEFAAMEERAQQRRAAANNRRATRMAKNMPAGLRTSLKAGGNAGTDGDLAGTSLKAGEAAGARAKIGEVAGGMTGSKKGLVILVNYSDKTMASGNTQTAFNNQFNQEGYSKNNHSGSVHDYFYDQSYGQFDLTFDVVGPVTVSKKMSYYGSNDSNGDDEHPGELVIEACKLADKQGVNFADYDWDGDGEVDQVFVIYAGYGESWGAAEETIWPHEWSLTSCNYYGDGSGALTLDGVKIDTYACSCELAGKSGTTMDGIGTACHEFSHCLGYPDFYDTSYEGGYGMGSWDLMDSGSYNGPNNNGERPCGYTAYERWCAGWLEPTELDEAYTVTGMAPLNDEAEAYIIYNDKNSNEFILLENRQNKGWFKYVADNSTPHGLLAYHVDYNATAWANNEPNKDKSHQRMTIIPANGNYGTLEGTSGDYYYSVTESVYKGNLFGGSGSVTALTGSSHKDVYGKWFTACSTGSTTLNHAVTEVANASDGSISFLFDGGAIEDDGMRYTVTFNAGTGICTTKTWQQTDFQEVVTMPTCISPSSDWTFIGWSTVLVSEGDPCPTIYNAYTTYLPTANTTFYAVYKNKTGGSTGSGNYEKVSEAPTDWSGDYLIVYTNNDTDGFVFDGSLTTLDNVKNYQKQTISESTLSGTACEGYKFTIASKGSGNYSVKSASGKYIGASGSKNTLNQSDSDDYNNTIALNSDGTALIKCGSKTLSFNNANDQLRFRYYGTAQKSIYLYKKSESVGTYTTNPEGGTVAESQFTVNYVANGATATKSQSEPLAAVAVPTVTDVVTAVEGGNGTYKFVGWSRTDITEETTMEPVMETLVDGEYVPTADETFYAVYALESNNYVKGFTLSIESSGTTYNLGGADISGKKFTASQSEALTLYFEDGYLWCMDGGEPLYVYNKSDNTDLYFTESKEEVTTTWSKTERDGTVSFLSSKGRYLGLNGSIVRAYASSYAHQWAITYTGEKVASGEAMVYTSHPRLTVVTMANFVEDLKNKVKVSDFNLDGKTTSTDIKYLKNRILEK